MSIQNHFFSKPKTKLGVWSVALTVIFLVMMTINNAVLMGLPENLRWRPFLIGYSFVLIGCGLAAGIVALLALVRKHERSWMVWLPILAGLFVLFLLTGEFLVPH